MKYFSSNRNQVSNPKYLNVLQKYLLNKMSELIECPICYDEIDQFKNCVTTECGHQFHCKCLMQNSAQNGFSCPMCRSTMATEPDISDSEDEYEEYSDDDDEDEDEPYDDNALTSFRMFHQQLDNEEVEENPEEEGRQPQEEAEEEQEQIVKPTAATIAAKLVAQGFTMEDMVNCLLIDHEEYEEETEKYERLSDRMFGKFRQIISNYPREQQEEQEIRVSSRLRVEDGFATMQNRYRILQDNDISDSEDNV